jgi:Fur family ferric uptake transcriptional regulator
MKSKLTRSQQKIFDFLNRSPQPLSAQEIYSGLRTTEDSVGLATVYRSLDTLKLEGLLSCRTLDNGEAVYSCLDQDQHHLNCVNCGQAIEIKACPVHQLERELEQSHGFKIYYHTLEFFGLCQTCQEA